MKKTLFILSVWAILSSCCFAMGGGAPATGSSQLNANALDNAKFSFDKETAIKNAKTAMQEYLSKTEYEKLDLNNPIIRTYEKSLPQQAKPDRFVLVCFKNPANNSSGYVFMKLTDGSLAVQGRGVTIENIDNTMDMCVGMYYEQP